MGCPAYGGLISATPTRNQTTKKTRPSELCGSSHYVCVCALVSACVCVFTRAARALDSSDDAPRSDCANLIKRCQQTALVPYTVQRQQRLAARVSVSSVLCPNIRTSHRCGDRAAQLGAARFCSPPYRSANEAGLLALGRAQHCDKIRSDQPLGGAPKYACPLSLHSK